MFVLDFVNLSKINMNTRSLFLTVFVPTLTLCVVCFKERMETANKQLAAKECDGSEDNRKTISQLLVQSEYHTQTFHSAISQVSCKSD